MSRTCIFQSPVGNSTVKVPDYHLLSYIVAAHLIRKRECLQRPVSVIQETPRGGRLDLLLIFPLFCILMLFSSSDIFILNFLSKINKKMFFVKISKWIISLSCKMKISTQDE